METLYFGKTFHLALFKKEFYMQFRKKMVFSLILVFSLLLIGCGGNKNVMPEGSLKFNYNVNNISVVYDDKLKKNKTTRLDKLNAKTGISDKVSALLKSSNKWDASANRDLKITVTKFRIRSGATVFWMGFMAGVDLIDAKVDVMENGQVIQTVSTGISSGFGGMSQTNRFNRLVDGLSRRVLYEL